MTATALPPRPQRVIEKRALHDEILPILRQEIVSAKWNPGQRLPESLLCERFGVSRTPLRDALKALAAEGLIALSHNTGAIVTRPNTEDIQDKLAVLELVECYAAREACAKASDAELRRIAKLHKQMGEAFARRDMDRNYRLNNEVHAAIIKASHNSTLVDIHANLFRHIERLRYLSLVHEDVGVDSWAEHDRFVSALLNRDAAAAYASLKSHLRRVARKILEELNEINAPKPPRRAPPAKTRSAE